MFFSFFITGRLFHIPLIYNFTEFFKNALNILSILLLLLTLLLFLNEIYKHLFHKKWMHEHLMSHF